MMMMMMDYGMVIMMTRRTRTRRTRTGAMIPYSLLENDGISMILVASLSNVLRVTVCVMTVHV